MSTKELLKLFVIQAVFFHTDDNITKALGALTWIALVSSVVAIAVLINMVST